MTHKKISFIGTVFLLVVFKDKKNIKWFVGQNQKCGGLW
jgi:hypothetical protein